MDEEQALYNLKIHKEELRKAINKLRDLQIEFEVVYEDVSKALEVLQEDG